MATKANPTFPIAASGEKTDTYFNIIDSWHALLNESLITFGPHAKRVHGLDEARSKFGIAEIVRNYDSRNRPELLSLLESLGPDQTSFDFCSRLTLASGLVADVHWIGSLDVKGNRINGVILITEHAHRAGGANKRLH